jgi:hypothetical protein
MLIENNSVSMILEWGIIQQVMIMFRLKMYPFVPMLTRIIVKDALV